MRSLVAATALILVVVDEAAWLGAIGYAIVLLVR